MKISKKTKIAVLTFVALGLTGIGIIKVKQIIDKRRAKRNKQADNKVLKVIFNLPEELK